MSYNLIEIILASAESAFIEVGVFVGAVLLLFGYINFIQAGAFVDKIEKSKKWQPVIGAFLGLTPGCGGAIFVMPLFFKGTVTFGTVVATLIATMGDSAFVIIAAHPFQYMIVSALSLVIGILTGYLVDRTEIGPRLLKQHRDRMRSKEEISKQHKQETHTIEDIRHLGHREGDEIDLALHHGTRGHQPMNTLAYRITHQGFWVFWLILAVGLGLGIMDIMQIDINALIIPNLGLFIGVGGTLLSVAFMLLGRKLVSSDTHEETEQKAMSLRETLIHNAQETAFVIVWVFVGFLVYEMFVLALGRGDYLAGEVMIESMLMTVGLASVIIGATVGLIPGCGPQILFVALYGRGLIPFAALLTNAISQDGDALFPLLAIDRKTALWATMITTVPALLFGLVAYWFELHTVLGRLFNF